MENIKELTCDIAECLLNNHGVCKCGSRNRGECDCKAAITEPPEYADTDSVQILTDEDKPRWFNDANRCVCCGEIIPEGLLVCYKCERG